MIKVTCDHGKIKAELDGKAVTLLSELCIIVDSVCANIAEDIDGVDNLKNTLITEVANALLKKIGYDEKYSK